MLKNNQEGYLTLGWIINESEQGLFLAVADEMIQSEIVRIYAQGAVGLYDYRRHPGAYSFHNLSEWAAAQPEIQTFIIANLQFALQSEEDLKRLNVSRDMLAGMKKNLIFLTTVYGDDRLAVKAYDFYSFIKLRILFHDYEKKRKEEPALPAENNPAQEQEGEAKGRVEETYALLRKAVNARRQARYQESEEMLLKVRRIREKLLGEGHLEVAAADYELAKVYEKEGKYTKAETVCRRALNIRETVLGRKHPDTMYSYISLAAIFAGQGKYAEAEKLQKRTLPILERILGEAHPDVIGGMISLANWYKVQGKYPEAEKLYKEVLSISKTSEGCPDLNDRTASIAGGRQIGNEELAGACNNLAVIYGEQGEYAKAEALLKKALSIDEKGKESCLDTVGVYNNLAILYEKQGKAAEAKTLYEKVVVTSESRAQEEDLRIVRLNSYQAAFYEKQGKVKEAEEVYKGVVAVMEKMLGENHPDTANSYYKLAILCEKQGKDKEAEELYKKAEDIRSRTLGKKHRSFAELTKDSWEMVMWDWEE